MTKERWDRRTANSLRTWAARRGYDCATWLTAEEVAEHGVKPGPWARPVELEIGNRITLVYNAAEIRGLPEVLYRTFWEIHPVHNEPRHPGFEGYVESLGLDIRHFVERSDGRTAAEYNTQHGFIQMPPYEMFFSAHDYYHSLAHELVHWAAANTDLVKTILESGDADYARNELVAEIAAVFLLAELGVSDVPHPKTATYVRTWRDKGSLTDAQAMDAAEDAARVATWLCHEAPEWRAGDGGTRRQTPPDNQGHRRPPASPLGLADAPVIEATAAARRFVADAFALERSIEGKERAAWDREAARLLEAADRIDLGIPDVVTAIEAAVALETSFARPLPAAAEWLEALRERTARILNTRETARSATDMSAGTSRGPRF